MPRWLIAAGAYIVVTGALGVTSKVALRSLGFGDVLVWTAIAYVAAAAIAIAAGVGRVTFGGGSGYAFLSGSLAAASLVCLFVALADGPVTRVIPVTSAYPVVALALGVVILGDKISPATVLGTLLVVVGVAVIASGR